MIEGDLVELHLSLEQPFVMAAFSQATLVFYFGPRLGFDIEFCPVAAHHDQPFDLFPQLGPDATARRIMAHAAFDILMG
jgi:hypothetical protein